MWRMRKRILLSTKQVAERLGVTQSRARQLIHGDPMVGEMVLAGRLFIFETDVLRLKERNTVAGRKKKEAIK